MPAMPMPMIYASRGSRRIGALFQCALHRINDGLGDHQVGGTLVLAVDDGPAREIVVGHAQKLVVALIRLVVVFQMLKIAVGHTPCSRRIGAQLAQALLLRLFGHMHEELHDHIAIGRKLAFELAGGGAVGLREVLFIGVEQTTGGRGVPAALVDGHLAAHAQRIPKFLHERLEPGHAGAHVAEALGLFLVKVGEHMHMRGTGIQVVEQIADAAAFAGTLPSLEQNHEAQTFRASLLLQNNELGQ